MSPDAVRAEDLFLDWLLALPEPCDPSVAAASRLAELRRGETLDAAEAGFCELLRQVTPFAAPPPRRRGARARVV